MIAKPLRSHADRNIGSVARERREESVGSLRIGDSGWFSGATRILSPNCDDRPAGATISLIVVHGISLPPGRFGGDGVQQLFTNALDPAADPYYPGIAHLRVSSHFFIRRDGELQQFVACGLRAWHAGVSSWRGRAACNDYSIGIELEGTDDVPYASSQYRVLAKVARALKGRYPIRDMVGHSHVAPGRKSDPGPAFDWLRLGRLLGAGATDGVADGPRLGLP
jgi:N-acetyl-anhydromuramoyl-L-alanine amidase